MGQSIYAAAQAKAQAAEAPADGEPAAPEGQDDVVEAEIVEEDGQEGKDNQ